MHTKLFTFIAIGLFVALLSFDHAEAQRKPKEELNKLPCKAAVSYLMKQVMGGISKCSKTMKFKNQKERTAKMNCILKCVMISEGILNPDGTADVATVKAFVDREVPEKFIGKVMPMVSNCIDDPKVKLDPTEEYCKSYEPPIKCLMDQMPTFCEKNPDL
ncbi:unnamed protein product [Allacma fusca]|uniref:Uncharacterized protein n=1 Tax=Allacma fusca TaxID=39272 RepID=A0A8J2L4W1_9HEXA|nr:unnamed protein product [Allacma fusca]